LGHALAEAARHGDSADDARTCLVFAPDLPEHGGSLDDLIVHKAGLRPARQVLNECGEKAARAFVEFVGAGFAKRAVSAACLAEWADRGSLPASQYYHEVKGRDAAAVADANGGDGGATAGFSAARARGASDPSEAEVSVRFDAPLLGVTFRRGTVTSVSGRAAGAGARLGDRFVAVAGQPADGLSDARLFRLIQRHPERPLAVTLARRGGRDAPRSAEAAPRPDAGPGPRAL
jgi:hypothetical protein